MLRRFQSPLQTFIVDTKENRRNKSATRSLGAEERRSQSQRIAGCIRNAIATMEYPITWKKDNVIYFTVSIYNFSNKSI